MAEVVFDLVIVFVVGVALFALTRYLIGSADRRSTAAIEAPPDARWRAAHVGTSDNRTEVVVVLQSGERDEIWDRRTCAVIDNLDPDYDKVLFNALTDARDRAVLLNNLRDG